MTLLYFVFGKKLENHQMVQFSFLSYFALSKERERRVVVMTDEPQYYNRYKDMVIVKPIAKELIVEWQGTHKFFWRAKIKAIESIIREYSDDSIVYLDGDTFFYGDLQDMNRILSEGKAMMHKDEGHPSTMKTKTLRMWKTIDGHTYGGVTMGMNHNMWNAGVVAMPAHGKQEAINLALSICDGMLDDGAEPIVVEQYSLSIALKEVYGLIPAESYIGHYWGNKPEWQELITHRMIDTLMIDRSIMEEIDSIRDIDFSAIPIYAHYSSWRERLQKKLNKVFQNPKRTEYVINR